MPPDAVRIQAPSALLEPRGARSEEAASRESLGMALGVLRGLSIGLPVSLLGWAAVLLVVL